MGDALEPEDVLLRKISELRGLVDQLIDEQINLLDSLQEEESLAAVPLAMAENGVEHHLSTLLPLLGSALQTKSVGPANSSESNHRKAPPVKRPSLNPPAPESPQPVPADRVDDNPRLRLDALARHLDDRLRKARDSSGDRPKPPA